MENFTIGIVGNPNCGKSTIFNQLTQLAQKTGNWPGVTIEKRYGTLQYKNLKIQLTDLPGLYSLGVGGKFSIDKKISINYIQNRNFKFLINVVDSVNFKRNLYLTLQLLERKIPIILVLNMDDLAKKKGVLINKEKLSRILGVPITTISAKNKKDIGKLKDFVIQNKNIYSSIDIFNLYPTKIRQKYLKLVEFLHDRVADSSNKEIITLLEGNVQNYSCEIRNFLDNICKDIKKEFGQELDFVLVNCRHNCVEKISSEIFQNKYINSESFSDKVDRIVLNKFLGIPIFLVILFFMFIFSINIGGIFQGLFSLTAEITLIDIPLLITSKIYTAEWLNILIKGLGGAIQTVVSLIPIIAAMYLFLSLVEDSGYIARATTIANKIMKCIGLSGQSFLPLVVGVGCNVPAIAGTRVLSNQNERIVTIMMIPFVSCTARLAVYTLFCYIFFPHNTQNIIFILYCLGIMVAIVTGLLLKNKTMQLDIGNMLIELPEYKMPKLKTIVNSSILRTKSFIFGAGKIIVVVFLIIHLLNYIKLPVKNSRGEYNNEPIISVVGKSITPIFEPLGLKEKNWPAAVGIITGIFAKEVVVGTLLSLYLNPYTNSDSVEKFNILSKYKEELFSIPKNFQAIFSKNFLKLDTLNDKNMKEEYWKDNKLNHHLIKNISENFNDKIAVLSYLIFILIYFPCVSVFGVISNEIGNRWALVSALWSTICAYSISTIFYQTANYILNDSMNYYYFLLGSLSLLISSISLRICSKSF